MFLIWRMWNYRQPSENVNHFGNTVAAVLCKNRWKKNCYIVGGDMDSDIVRLLNEDVITNMSIEVSYRYLPYITLPSRIAQLSTTCTDNVLSLYKSSWAKDRYYTLWYVLMWIIALWGWFCRDVLPVTCCEHGPPSIATVHFSNFPIATNILFN